MTAGDFFKDKVEAVVRFRNRCGGAKDGVIPSARLRLRPLRLAVLTRILDHNTHTHGAHVVLRRAEDPHSRLFHLDDSIDTFRGGEHQDRHGSGIWHGVPVERNHIEIMSRQRQANIVRRARVEHMKQNAIAGSRYYETNDGHYAARVFDQRADPCRSDWDSRK